MKLAIEMSDGVHTDAYARVHRAGCKHLRDPEPIGEAVCRAEIPGLIEDTTGWDVTSDPAFYRALIAPCVALP